MFKTRSSFWSPTTYKWYWNDYSLARQPGKRTSAAQRQSVVFGSYSAPRTVRSGRGSTRGTCLYIYNEKIKESCSHVKRGKWDTVVTGLSLFLMQAIVKSIPAACFLQILSNGIFKSPMHRVVINSETERNSLACSALLILHKRSNHWINLLMMKDQKCSTK